MIEEEGNDQKTVDGLGDGEWKALSDRMLSYSGKYQHGSERGKSGY